MKTWLGSCNTTWLIDEKNKTSYKIIAKPYRELNRNSVKIKGSRNDRLWTQRRLRNRRWCKFPCFPAGCRLPSLVLPSSLLLIKPEAEEINRSDLRRWDTGPSRRTKEGTLDGWRFARSVAPLYDSIAGCLSFWEKYWSRALAVVPTLMQGGIASDWGLRWRTKHRPIYK